MRIFKKIILFSLMISLSLYADFYDEQMKIIEAKSNPNSFSFSKKELNEFQNNQPFGIVSGTIKLNPIGGFADGEYKLYKANIQKVSSQSYSVALEFKLKKKKYLSYKHSEKIEVLYNTYKFWIKYKNRVYRYTVPQPYYEDSMQNHRVLYRFKRDNLNISLDNIKLVVKF